MNYLSNSGNACHNKKLRFPDRYRFDICKKIAADKVAGYT